MRLHLTLTDEQAARLGRLCQETGHSPEEVARRALDAYYTQIFGPAEPAAIDVLEAVGFIGCADAAPDLSAHYKPALTTDLARKHEDP